VSILQSTARPSALITQVGRLLLAPKATLIAMCETGAFQKGLWCLFAPTGRSAGQIRLWRR
jgi:hypothetical protein